MTPLDDLPAEQRAVLELVLKRGRTYDEIAALLTIDRAAVRQRALTGLDALGPSTSVPPERRALITDYLLGQLPERVSEQVSRRLATEASERAWARVIASELSPLAAAPLPRIPTGTELQEAEPEDVQEAEDERELRGLAPAPGRGGADGAARSAGGAGRGPAGPLGAEAAPRSSRLGGAILLGLGALIVVVVIVVLLLNSGSSKSPTASTITQSSAGAGTTGTGTSTATTTGTGTGTTGTTPQTLATVKLSPVTAGSKAQGVAEAFSQSGTPYLAVVAINLAANSHNYYAVWLTNGSTDSRLLGFSPPVTSNGRLQAATPLKTTDSHYKTMVLTLETQPHPRTPGTPVLSGPFALKSP